MFVARERENRAKERRELKAKRKQENIEKHNIKKKPKYKILELWKDRWLELFGICDTLEECWKLNFKNAKNSMTYQEWLKVQHFYLSEYSYLKEKVIELLNKQ